MSSNFYAPNYHQVYSAIQIYKNFVKYLKQNQAMQSHTRQHVNLD